MACSKSIAQAIGRISLLLAKRSRAKHVKKTAPPCGASAPSVVAAPRSFESRLQNLEEHSRQLLQAARRAIEDGDLSAADSALERARVPAGHHPEYLRLRGIVRIKQQRPAEAVALIRQALAILPDDAAMHANLGSALRDAGELDAAIASLRRACELDPGLPGAWMNLGHALRQANELESAHAAFAQAVGCDPRHLPARLSYAESLQAFGDGDAAAEQYRHVLARMPDSALAWSGLAGIKTLRLSEADVAALRRLRARRDLAPDDRIRAGFALAKALEDQERYAEAFAVLREANALARSRMRWDAAHFTHAISGIASAFAMPQPAALDRAFGRETIFIVSLPRSGSTLVEQILASHSDVAGAGELPDLAAALKHESRRRGMEFPRWVTQASLGDWRRLGEEYRAATARWREKRPVFTDKALSNWQFVGAALAMLPGARVVHVQRDPVETCLSCFRHRFASGQAHTYDLGEMANYWRDYDRLTRFWHSRHTDRMHRLVYEDLLANPDVEIGKLLEFCGLPFDSACLRYYETPRGIRTISATQVREPLRRDTARAHRYGDLVAPLRSAIAAAGA